MSSYIMDVTPLISAGKKHSLYHVHLGWLLKAFSLKMLLYSQHQIQQSWSQEMQNALFSYWERADPPEGLSIGAFRGAVKAEHSNFRMNI